MCRSHRNQDGVFERRKFATLAKFQLLLKIAGEIVVARELDRRTERRVGLQRNFTSVRRGPRDPPPESAIETFVRPRGNPEGGARDRR